MKLPISKYGFDYRDGPVAPFAKNTCLTMPIKVTSWSIIEIKFCCFRFQKCLRTFVFLIFLR